MNKEDKIQYERELVRVSTLHDEARREGKKKTEARRNEELQQLLRHL